ncbi:MAG: PspA/IM30 family protein, partial [Gemmataceae bacterium]
MFSARAGIDFPNNAKPPANYLARSPYGGTVLEGVMGELILRVIVWGILPLMLIAIGVGPGRTWRAFKRLWAWIDDRRHEPTEVLNRVVHEHEKNIRQLKDVLAQSETAQNEIVRNMRRSEESVTALDREAKTLAAIDDDLGARAALYKLNLERLAINGFKEQLANQKQRIDQARRRLHLLELQLRQYEVGRSILLAQLAEAKTVEQQYALASQFDPFSAVAAWTRAEGSVQQASQNARAVEQVFHDT